MEVKKLISAACSAAMLTALIPAQLSAEAAAPKQATYISDILLAGFSSLNNAGAAMDAKNRLISSGYTVVDTDLNSGCGTYSERIYLGYKTTTDPKEAIKDVIIVDKFITDISAKVTENGVKYSLCPFDGDLYFGDVSGDLNSGAGGIDAHLFYTKEGDSAYAISDIVFDDNSASAVSGTDLNDGASCRDKDGNVLDTPVDKIYMHTVKSGSIVHNEANDSYYRVFNAGMSWENAKNYCEDLGGHLVTITDEAEQKYMLDLVKPTKKEICWIGGYRSRIDGETWITGEEFTYDKWDSILASSYTVDNVPFALRTETGFWSLTDPGKHSFLTEDLCFVCEWDNIEGYNKKTDFNGHTYQAFDRSLSWKEAEEYCESLGGHLAVITSDEENKFIASLINNGKTYHYWLGGSIDSKGNFSWVTHENTKYTNWSQFVAEEETVNIDHIAMQRGFEDWGKHSEESYNKYKDDYGFICEWEDTSAVEFNGSRYLVINDSTTWHQAVSYCEDLGGHLVTITSAEEQAFVYGLFQTKSEYDVCWIGGLRNQNTGFSWITDEAFDYSNWSEILAQNYSEDEIPLAMNRDNGEWELIDPEWQYNFDNKSCYICEWDKGFGDKLSWSNHDLQYFDIGLSWKLAERYCESLGGHLASIDNQIDEEDVKKLLRNGTKDVYWLGGKLNDDDEVEWLSEDYLADGWEHWAPGNPDKEEFGEYVLLHRTRSANRPPYSWSSADNTCASYGKENLGFICEWDKEMVYFYAPMTEPAQYLSTTTTSSATTTASTSTTTTAVSSTAISSTSKSTTATSTTTSATTTTASSPVYTPLYGDVNCDGKVDTKDLTALNNFLNDRALYMLSPHGILNADAYNTGDGIDANDATAINYYINGIISELPYSGAFPQVTEPTATSTTTTTTTTTTAKPTTTTTATTTTTTTTAQPTTTTTTTTTAKPTTTTTTTTTMTTTTTTTSATTATTTQPTTTTTSATTAQTTTAATTTAPVTTTGLCGDVNCDGKVDTKDLTALNDYLNDSTANPLSPQGLANADTYNPGSGINANDSYAILLYLSGNITSLPYSGEFPSLTETTTSATSTATTTTTSVTTTTTTQPTTTTTSATTTTTTQPTTTTTSVTTTTTTQPTTTTTSATTTTTTQPTTTTTSATTTTTTQPTTTMTSATTTTTTQPTTTTTSATTTTTTQPTTTTTSATTTTTTQPTTTTTSATTTTTTQPTTTTTSATTTTTTQPTTTTTSVTTTTTTQPTTTMTSATTTTTTQPTTTTTSVTTTTTTQPTTTTTTTSATTTTTTQPTTTTTSATTTATTTTEPPVTTTPSLDLGDVNNDGKVDAKDASRILVAYAKASTGEESGLTEAESTAADVNSDNKVDAKDASRILAYYALVSTAEGDIPTLKEFVTPKTA